MDTTGAASYLALDTLHIDGCYAIEEGAAMDSQSMDSRSMDSQSDAYRSNRRAQMAIREEIAALRVQLEALQRDAPGAAVANHSFDTRSGPVTLQTLFAGESHLILIHNMGISCNHCTLWADGFNGLYDHLRSKAAFVVASPNELRVQESFANSRGWRFPMVRDPESEFARSTGYATAEGPMPGTSIFVRDGDQIRRIADAPFGEHDLFCAIWPLFEMLGEHGAGWEPRLKYS